MRGDDLTSLFITSTPDVGFHQGLVLTWDAGTGANSIQVAGAVLGNVPILNTGEAIALKAGHVVGLLRFRSTWFILGRITIPGQSDFAAASVAFDTIGTSSSAFTLDTTQTDRLSSNAIVVPSWADEALVHVTAQCSALNNTAGAAILNLRTGIDGVYGAQHFNLSTGAKRTYPGPRSAPTRPAGPRSPSQCRPGPVPATGPAPDSYPSTPPPSSGA